MAQVRRTLKEAERDGSSQVDFDKLDATTDADIARHTSEDGFDAAAPFAGLTLRGGISPATVRQRIGMSQDKFAAAIGVPVKTLRNWEQGRTVPDPAAQSLLKLVAADTEHILTILAD